MIVAIDGPAGVGKSTIAQKIAQECGFFYVNSGNFYRAITYKHIQNERDLFDEQALIETAQASVLSIRDSKLYIDDELVEEKLHTDLIDSHVARISAIIPVRVCVNKALQEVATYTDIIIEGRDITTVVFPHAELKFYFDASIEIRAQRRYKQQDTSLSVTEIEQEIEKRDRIDTGKEFGALRVSDDADYIDTSYLTIDAVCEKVVKKIINFRKKTDQES
jgi:CMP/dCMP kinase